jgi:hypothetical protein
MTRHLVWPFAVLFAFSATAFAQSPVIAGSRSIDWRNAGVTGGIPARSTVCTTLSPGATAAQINSAIAACPNGQVVFLAAGTYTLSTGIIFNAKNGVTLRGAGPDQTFLKFTAGNACGGLGGDVCFINGNANWAGGPVNTANWTAGYSPGTTSITLDNKTNLQVGSVLILDQIDDGSTDTGEVWTCQLPSCSQQGGIGQGRPGVTGGGCGGNCRGQTQVVRVTSISSGACPCTIGITPGLYMPNWRAAKNPGAWWSSALPITGSGIEDLSLDHGSSSARGGVFIYNGDGIWVRNVRSLNANQKHVWMYQSVHTTVRDSYFYGTQAASSDSYATDTLTGGDHLIENNIFEHVASPMLNEGGQGTVHAYNYAIDDYYTKGGATEWQQASSYQHAVGNAFILWEGNSGIGLTADDIHGTSHFVTAFRNHWNGRDPAGGSSGGKDQSTNAVLIQAYNRYYNFVGNVLGTSGYHSRYEVAPTSATDPGSASNANAAVYNFGYSANQGTYWTGPPALPNDLLAKSTAYRWGNYDTVTDSVRWNAAEVPSGLAKYAQPVPPSQDLPDSLYLPGKPGWFGSHPWPAIGPDIADGDVPNVGGHVYKIPAQVCFETTPKTSGILNFNANRCYPRAPASPTSVRVTGGPD